MKTKRLLLVPVIFLSFTFSCKEKEIKFSPVHFYLMDSPSGFDSINIHIKKIEANVITDSAVWVPVDTKDTMVNVFHLQDSITLQVAHDNVPMGLLKRIRFILGNDNSVVVKGISYPLQLPATGYTNDYAKANTDTGDTLSTPHIFGFSRGNKNRNRILTPANHCCTVDERKCSTRVEFSKVANKSTLPV